MVKKRKNNNERNISKGDSNYFFGAFVFLVLLFLFLYFNSDGSFDEPVDYTFYNDYEFKKVDGFENVWETSIRVGASEEKIKVRYHPLDLEDIPYDANATSLLYFAQKANSEVVISFSRDVLYIESGKITLAGYDLTRVLSYFFGFKINVSGEGLEDYDWIGCDMSSPEQVVVTLKKGPARIESSPFCVDLYFDTPDEAVQVSSLFIYNLLGIMR